MLDVTTGGSQTNSFCLEAEADAFLNEAPFDIEDWESLDNTRKQSRLRMAANLLAHLPWRGYRLYENQALCFPRTYQSNVTEIPVEIKRAQAYTAFLVVHRGFVNFSSPSEGVEGPSLKSFNLAGKLSVTYGATKDMGSGSNLARLVRNSEFPIFAELSNHLTVFRSRGSGERPKLLSPTE